MQTHTRVRKHTRMHTRAHTHTHTHPQKATSRQDDSRHSGRPGECEDLMLSLPSAGHLPGKARGTRHARCGTRDLTGFPGHAQLSRTADFSSLSRSAGGNHGRLPRRGSSECLENWRFIPHLRDSDPGLPDFWSVRSAHHPHAWRPAEDRCPGVSDAASPPAVGRGLHHRAGLTQGVKGQRPTQNTAEGAEGAGQGRHSVDGRNATGGPCWGRRCEPRDSSQHQGPLAWGRTR